MTNLTPSYKTGPRNRPGVIPPGKTPIPFPGSKPGETFDVSTCYAQPAPIAGRDGQPGDHPKDYSGAASRGRRKPRKERATRTK